MTIEWGDAPEACVKCAAPLRLSGDQTLDRRIVEHFRAVHPASIGHAVAAHREPFEFAYVRPAYYRTEPTWIVVLLGASVRVTELRVRKWTISWDLPGGPKAVESDYVL